MKSRKVVIQLPKHLCRRSRKTPCKARSPTGHISTDESGTPYQFPFVRNLHPNPATVPGMEFRSSLSWFTPNLSHKRFRAVPFVTRSGKFSLHTHSVWKCFPEQFIFSLISTVYSRLLAILRKRKNSSRRLLNCAFKVSVCYVLTRNNQVIDRFLGISNPRVMRTVRSVENLVHFFVSELDENKRFVYSQAYFQANWLKFQVFRPSDKSRDEVKIGSHLTHLGLDRPSLCDDSKLSATFHLSCDMWTVTAISFVRKRARKQVCLGLSSFSSELLPFNKDPEVHPSPGSESSGFVW
jgi:hypothetical protein